MSTSLGRPPRRADRYRSRWPDLFEGLAEWQIRAVVQRLENAALEGLRPTREDAAAVLAAGEGIEDPNSYLRAVMLVPLRPAPE